MGKIGPDWATATSPNIVSKLEITHGVPPWQEMAKTMSQSGNSSILSRVGKAARDLTHSFYAFRP